jgi:hypothetical protein
MQMKQSISERRSNWEITFEVTTHGAFDIVVAIHVAAPAGCIGGVDCLVNLKPF